MRPVAIRYVRDVDAVQRFYTALGLRTAFRSRPTRAGETRWLEMDCGPGLLALHGLPAEPEHARAEPAVELAFEAEEPLEDVVARLAAAGFPLETAVVDEAYGRSFRVRDPEGLVVQVNEQERDLQA